MCETPFPKWWYFSKFPRRRQGKNRENRQPRRQRELRRSGQPACGVPRAPYDTCRFIVAHRARTCGHLLHAMASKLAGELILMRELLAELTQALEGGRACVWCAVVETRGSTPQKAGAAMLVFADGSQAGTLGGGCVEAEVKRHALRTLADGAAQPQLSTFNLDDNYGWDDGLICGGRMSILAAPLQS